MNRTSLRRIAAPGIAALALSLTVTACGAANETAAVTTPPRPTRTPASPVSSRVPAPPPRRRPRRPGPPPSRAQNADVTITYDPVGSGDGRKQFIAKGVSFAGSDGYLKDDEGELSAAKERCAGTDPIEVPAYVSPIAVVYNLPGVTDLQLSAKTIAGIFDGKITKWNDAAIADENPDADLPGDRITPVHRSDDSGTTDNFTDYLNKAGEGAWKYDADGVWPTKGGEAAEGTSGVISAVTNGKGSIGYADESQAGDLGKVKVKVGEEYVAPEPEAAAKVVDTSPAAEGRVRRRHGHRHRPHHDRVRRLPRRAGLLPDRLPDLRRQGRSRPRQGLPLLHRVRGGPGRPPPRTPAPHRCPRPPRTRPPRSSRRSPPRADRAATRWRAGGDRLPHAICTTRSHEPTEEERDHDRSRSVTSLRRATR